MPEDDQRRRERVEALTVRQEVDEAPCHVGRDDETVAPAPEGQPSHLAPVPVVVGEDEGRQQEEQLTAGVEDDDESPEGHGDLAATYRQGVHRHDERDDENADEVEGDDARSGALAREMSSEEETGQRIG